MIPDFPDPEAEAAGIVGLLPAGLGRSVMIENAVTTPKRSTRSKSPTPSCRSSGNSTMPRVGLNTAAVVAFGAGLADESGIGSVSLAALAQRLGVKAPALYKHVDSVGDLQHRIATLAMTEFGNGADALQGKSGADAIGAISGRSSPT